VADYDFPPDLLQLQRDWYAADARCVEIGASHPAAVDVVAGTAQVSDAQYRELKDARAERWLLTEQLRGHAWWASVDDTPAAKAALRAAARGSA
jgi:hypothetical protein